jgi:ribonuclease BN (tRNA processing enzyme)
MTADEAGRTGADAGVDRLVVTHVWPTNPKEAVQERASEAFGAEVDVAVEGMRIPW